MVSRIRGLGAWVAGVMFVIGCSGEAMGQAQAAAPVSARDSAVLYVLPPGSKPALPAGEPPAASRSTGDDAIWQRSIASHAHMIAHPSNLYHVLTSAQSKVRDARWFARQASPEDAVAWLQQHFKATPVPGTALIELSLDSDADRAEAATIVNAIASQYLERDRQIASGKLIEQIDLFMNLKTRYEAQARSMRTDTNNLAAILQLDGMGRPGVSGQKEQELQLLIAERIKESAEAAAAENAFKLATEEAQKGRILGVVAMQIDQSWEIVSLRQQMKSLMELALGNAQVDARVEAIKRQLDERSAELRKTLSDTYLANLNAQWQSRKARVEVITKLIEQLKQDLAELNGRMTEYLVKRDEEAAYRELARRYADQLDRLNVTRQRIDLGEIVFAAMATERPR